MPGYRFCHVEVREASTPGIPHGSVTDSSQDFSHFEQSLEVIVEARKAYLNFPVIHVSHFKPLEKILV